AEHWPFDEPKARRQSLDRAIGGAALTMADLVARHALLGERSPRLGESSEPDRRLRCALRPGETGADRQQAESLRGAVNGPIAFNALSEHLHASADAEHGEAARGPPAHGAGQT